MSARLSPLYVIIAVAVSHAQTSGPQVSDTAGRNDSPDTVSATANPDSILPPVETERTFQLERVVVRSMRRARLLAAPQSLSVIESKEWKGSGKTVADIMEEQTAVQTRRYGGTGSFQTISIRGVPGDHIRVLLDGMPLNSAMGGAVDLGKINPDRIESIEMYKGIAPAALSGNGMGGIVVLNSKKGANERSFNASASAGSFGYTDQALSFHKTSESGARVFGLLSSRHSDNDYPYLDRNNTPYTDSDDTLRTVQNSQYDAFEAVGNVSKQWAENVAARAGFSHARSKSGVPGKEGHVNETARFYSEGSQFSSGLDYTTGSGVRISPEIGFRLGEDETYWTWKDDIGFGGMVPGQIGRRRYRDRKTVFAIGFSFYPNDWFGSTARGEAMRENLNPITLEGANAFGDWESKQENALLAADAHLKFGPLGTVLGAGIEGCRATTEGGTDFYWAVVYPPARNTEMDGSLRAGMNYRIAGAGALFANAARYHRFPSIRERYGSGGGLLANPEIRTEQGYNYDLGFKWLAEAVEAEFTGFRIQSRDAVIMLPAGPVVKPINIGASLSQGVESAIRIKPLQHVGLQMSSTLQEAINLSTLYDSIYYGKRLPNEPKLSLAARLNIGPLHRWDIQYEAEFKSAFYRDEANTQRIPEKVDAAGLLFHNIRFRYKPALNLEVILSALNLSGPSTQYNDISQNHESGYSWTLYPGREIRLSVYYSK